MVVSGLPESIIQLPASELGLVVNDIKNLVFGNIVSKVPDQYILAAAEHYRSLTNLSQACLAVVMLVLAIFGMVVILSRIKPTLRARNQVEKVINILMIAASSVAVFTTIGIVMSVLFEALRQTGLLDEED